MKVIRHIRRHVQRLLTSPADELGRWARFLRFQPPLWRLCARRLWEHNVTAMSAALSFRTIFALVPAIVLAVLVLQTIGALEDSKRSLRDFLDHSGFAQIALLHAEGQSKAPAGDPEAKVVNVAAEIEALVDRVESKLTFERVGPVGAALLIWTALSLLSTMERSLNRIFGARRSRPLVRRLLLYWSVLTLGPLLLAAASLLGRRLAHAFASAPGASWILAATGWAGPVVVGILVLAAVYKLLPHTDVAYRAAVGGAVVSVPLWLVAKWGFAVYVTWLVGTGDLYGALGLLPLFLIWLNLSWLIFLFGAELAHTATNLSDIQLEQHARDIVLGPADLLAAAIAVARPYQAGGGPAAFADVAARLKLPDESVGRLLDRLASAGLVCRVEGSSSAAYVLTRPPEKIPVVEVLGWVQGECPPGRAPLYAPEIAEAVSRSMIRAQSDLGTFTLAAALGPEQRPSRHA